MLVRHGETAWNAEQRLQGQEDPGLSTEGERQARALRITLDALLADVPTDRLTVVCSPLRRARETCDLLGLRPDRVDARWQEAHLGAWTGRTRAELEATGTDEYAAWRAGSFTPPEAEDHVSLRQRVDEAIGDLTDTDLALVITHGGPIRAASRSLVGLEQHRLLPVRPGSMTVFDTQGEEPRLRTYNLTPPDGPQLLREAPD